MTRNKFPSIIFYALGAGIFLVLAGSLTNLLIKAQAGDHTSNAGALAIPTKTVVSASPAPTVSQRSKPRKPSLPVLTGPADASIFPFRRNATWQRVPAKFDLLPKGDTLFRDGKACAVGCKPRGVIDGWPLRPFHEQHPLRAGLNELRESSLHNGVDIQAKDGSRVYAIQPGYARILQATGDDARVQVGNYVYWHVIPKILEDENIEPYKTILGKTMKGFGHLHFSEIGPHGVYLDPLRPRGRALVPRRDKYAPILGALRLGSNGSSISIFDPQSFTKTTTYKTPVTAPAFVAYRLWNKNGKAASKLIYVLRGSHNLPWRAKDAIYAPRARKVSFGCYARHRICKPHWEYRINSRTTESRGQTLRMTVYAWDWAGNASARDVWVHSNGSNLNKINTRKAKKLEKGFLREHYDLSANQASILRKHHLP